MIISLLFLTRRHISKLARSKNVFVFSNDEDVTGNTMIGSRTVENNIGRENLLVMFMFATNPPTDSKLGGIVAGVNSTIIGLYASLI